jgi:biotin transport system substrate-specific component
VGPTGGYLMGYLPAVFVAGYISEKTGKRFGGDILAMICATVVLYACGVTWLKILTGMTWSKTMMVGMLPFLIGDALKIVAAALIAKALRPVLHVTRNPK